MLNSTFAMASPAKKAEISFETAMERLEKIVEEMESGENVTGRFAGAI